MKLNSFIPFCLFFGLFFSVKAQTPFSSRVLLIPLDDRPPCLQFPVRMGLINDVELVSPPKELLGWFTDPGKTEEIGKWIDKQDLKTFDAAIISVDMLAYGGLVASRRYGTTEKEALEKMRIIEKIRRKAPQMKIYGSSVIMRLAPTGDQKNEAYRQKLANWAEIADDEKELTQKNMLEKEIPAEALENYKKARERDLAINKLSIDLAEKRVFDYLILSQDDAKPRGVHVKDRETLAKIIAEKKLSERIALQPGADEVSMLLLAHAMSDKYAYHPKIKAIYSSEAAGDKVMPFEDKPLRKTVSFHIRAVGAREVEDEKEAEILFYVFASRPDEALTKRFAEKIIASHQLNSHSQPKGIIIADVDPKGDVQGGDINFTEMLKKEHVFSDILGYACWNTAGNTIGTALPHGFLSGVAQKRINVSGKKGKALSQEILNRMGYSQTWFMLNRLLDDYTYHSVIRPKAQGIIRKNGWNSLRLSKDQTSFIEDYCFKALQPVASDVAENYFSPASGKQCTLSDLYFDLPWERAFEAEVDFKLNIRKNK
ncbi:Protein of unknown function [Pseudarcicella hirudinis]|uniref:DUF4127 family protein n=1 Tax=Pseudarcicella hirudinis TaxID=1079859 RepID=A0A1I5VGN1_9BACT|nr:DUF4127 family protein [Pseudarcicella hirudinis]SFQ06136.1 Protein of unknown function [Pseudarcicella hirudinis]